MALTIAGIEINPKFTPTHDPDFAAASLFERAYLELSAKLGSEPLVLSLERTGGSVSRFETVVIPPAAGYIEATLLRIERIVKFLLWQRGGHTVYCGGPAVIGSHLAAQYSPSGERAFDYEFMTGVYEQPFAVKSCTAAEAPQAKETGIALGRHLDGCRVGFDLGASDRKASAVIDGEAVFSEEVVWDPRNATDPEYHYQGVMDSIRRAASHLPRLDAVGGSAAGVYINNRPRVASLYRGVPKDQFEAKIAPMFERMGKELGVPFEVVNDGEVTALAGSMSLGENPVLGLAFGSSLAAGYVNREGNITGWLNELAFVPVDYRPGAPKDEWSGDGGCGVQYFNQVGANRISTEAGITYAEGQPLPERLVELQKLMAAGNEVAAEVYDTIGIMLGYGIAHYANFYDLKNILVLGRVTTGKGGDILLDTAHKVLQAEFPELAAQISVALPDEKSRRVGQSIAAASLPALKA
ncbi:MAG: ROK family protein [Bryobacteraceae bacterium]|nr:ROK family protein [Bryobacteraceae bacterium]